MDILRDESLNIKPTIPKCAVLAKTSRRRRIPAYNTLGPFPDEVLTMGLDRVLYFLGGDEIRKYFPRDSGSSVSASELSSTSSVSYQKFQKQLKACRQGTVTYPEENHGDGATKYSITNKSKCPKCQVCSIRTTRMPDTSQSLAGRLHTARKTKVDLPVDGAGYLRKSVQSLKRSFSLCSLACRKLKERLGLSNQAIDPPKWLWTKLQDYADGCQIYEVYTNSSVTSHPTQFETDKASKIIFVILPTGIIMPFETLTRHP